MALTGFSSLVLGSPCIRRIGYIGISTLLLLFPLLSLIVLVLGIMGGYGIVARFGEKVVKRVAARYISSQNGSHRFLLAHLFYSRASGLSFLARFRLMFLIMVSIGLCERLAGVRSGCFFSADGLLTKGDICTPAGPVCLLLLH